MASFSPFADARHIVFALGILPVLLGLAVVVRRRLISVEAHPPATPPHPAGIVVLAVGVAIFALTRADARDARAPLPRNELALDDWLDHLEIPEDPGACRAAPAVQRSGEGALEAAPWQPIDGRAPVVAQVEGALVVDGQRVLGTEALREILEAKRRVAETLLPNARIGVVVLALPPSMPRAAFAPLREAPAAAGFDELRALVARPRPVVTTHTLGPLARPRAGCTRVLHGSERPTWGRGRTHRVIAASTPSARASSALAARGDRNIEVSDVAMSSSHATGCAWR